MTAQQFLDRPLDPLNYYDVLPSDKLAIGGTRERAPLGKLCDIFLSGEISAAAESSIEDALLALLIGEAADVDECKLERVADHVSKRYAKLLADGKRNRRLRMKLAQLNFFIRDWIDRKIDAHASCLAEEFLDVVAPWDWLDTRDGRVLLASGGDGLHWVHQGIDRRASCGFPSQLDRLPGNRIAIGSIFTNGAYILNGLSLEMIPHSRPIVLVFERNGQEWAVDYAGQVFPINASGDRRRIALFQQVDRARKIGTQLFVADWSRPQEVGVVQLSDLSSCTIELPGILLMNDICELDGAYYAVCKQKGKVFAYDTEFRLLGERLGFGRGRGRLFDPISLRATADKISVLNWVTSTIVSLRPFA